MANTKLTEITKILSKGKDEAVTLEEMQEARAIYVDIAKEGFKTKKWTETNMALNKLNAGFMNFLDNMPSDLQDKDKVRRTLFSQEDGRSYNAVISKIVESKDGVESAPESLLSVKIKRESLALKLVDDYNFYLV